MHVLWISDSPTTPSGFGNVTRFVCAGLAARGFRVSILGWQTHGQPFHWNGCQVFPVRRDPFGADILFSYLQRLHPDVVIALADVWWMAFMTHPLIKNFREIANTRWALYYPIDGDTPEGRLPQSWIEMLRRVDIPIAMSRYGQDVTHACGLKSFMIPHGVDTSIFTPPIDRAAAKEVLGYQDRVVILSDARNQPRKMLPRLLEVFQRFADGKEDVILHLHCDPKDDSARSPLYNYDIISDLERLGLRHKVHFTSGFRMLTTGGLPLEKLAAIYQAADMHLLVSSGEGFGLPTLQATSAGVVPLATGYSANLELIDGHGEVLPVQRYLLNEFGLRRALIDVDQAAGRLDALYRDPERRVELSKKARRFAENYDWNLIIPQWADLLRSERGRSVSTYRPITRQVEIAARQVTGPADLAAAVGGAMKNLPGGAQVTFRVAEAKSGEVEAALQRDVFVRGSELSLPITLPPAFLGAPQRIPGRICLGPAEVGVFSELHKIFPGLVGLVFGGSQDQLMDAIRGLHWVRLDASKEEIAQLVASSTLILDEQGSLASELRLDFWGAALATPYLGRSPYWGVVMALARTGQPRLDRARHLLLEQGDAAQHCEEAQQRLIAQTGLPAFEQARASARLKPRREFDKSRGTDKAR